MAVLRRPVARPRSESPGPLAKHLALAVADAGWFTTENLFREVDRQGVSTLLLHCMDYRNALSRGIPPWRWVRPLAQSGPAHWQREIILPSGWMKRFPRLGMRPIGRAIGAWRRRLPAPSGLALVMTYPYYLALRDQVRPDHTVYFNVDDYALYWPERAREVHELERRAVRESDLTVCVSRLRADELASAVPEAAERIRHLPHGAPTAALARCAWSCPAPAPPDLGSLPRPILGYVGSMEDRVDWRLMNRLGEAFPEASVVVVGRAGVEQESEWQRERARFFARPNVHALGWRSQDQIPRYNSTFDVCLIPYLVDHPFNRACCPTKIMDYMVTGRPIVSTALPECRLSTHLFHVAEDDPAFLAAVREIVARGSDDGRAETRLAWARDNTCKNVAGRLLDMLVG